MITGGAVGAAAATVFLAADRPDVFVFAGLPGTGFFTVFFCCMDFLVGVLAAVFFGAVRVAFLDVVFLVAFVFVVAFLPAAFFAVFLPAIFFGDFFAGGFRVAALCTPVFFTAVFFLGAPAFLVAVFLVTFFARDVELDLRRAAVVALAALMGRPPGGRGIVAPGFPIQRSDQARSIPLY